MGKYTRGPAEVRKTLTSLYVVGGPTEYGRPTICDMPTLSNGAPCEDAAGDAALIADAFNVAHETGLTPRQLAEQRERLLATAKQYLETLRAFVWPFAESSDVRAPNLMALADQNAAALRDLKAAIADAEGTTP